MTSSKPVPYFSIIIPTLNEEVCLPNLLKNLSEQTFKQFETFVVDGQSTDKTREIVSSYSPKYPLSLITSDKRNVSYQRNLGAHQSQGKVLVFFDADTQIPKNYLEKIRTAYEVKRPHFLNTYMRVDSTKAKDQWFPAFSNLIAEIGRVVKFPAAYGAAMTIKSTTFQDIGGFDELTPFGEDSQLFQTAEDYNYKYIILASPRYTFSLRRLRAEGTLDAMYQYVRIHFSLLINGHHHAQIKYPMGGHVHQIKNNPPNLTQRFDTILNRLNHIPKDQSQKISVFIKRLLPTKDHLSP